MNQEFEILFLTIKIVTERFIGVNRLELCYNPAMNVEIKIFQEKLGLAITKDIAEATFGNMAKAVIDIEKRIIAVGGEFHADAEAVLLEAGSRQGDLWGINLYPSQPFDKMIEFDSLINIRPSANNRSQDVEDPVIRTKIIEIIQQMLAQEKKQ